MYDKIDATLQHSKAVSPIVNRKWAGISFIGVIDEMISVVKGEDETTAQLRYHPDGVEVVKGELESADSDSSFVLGEWRIDLHPTSHVSESGVETKVHQKSFQYRQADMIPEGSFGTDKTPYGGYRPMKLMLHGVVAWVIRTCSNPDRENSVKFVGSTNAAELLLEHDEESQFLYKFEELSG